LVELDIAADLAAAGNASRVCRERSTDSVASSILAQAPPMLTPT